MQGKLSTLLRAPDNDEGDFGPGCADGSNTCAPEVEANKGKLVFSANSGDIVFTSKSCPETDLCGMAKDLDALMSKFGNQ